MGSGSGRETPALNGARTAPVPCLWMASRWTCGLTLLAAVVARNGTASDVLSGYLLSFIDRRAIHIKVLYWAVRY